MTTHTIRILTPQQAQARRAELVDLLVDSVEGGASVNFVWPMTRATPPSRGAPHRPHALDLGYRGRQRRGATLCAARLDQIRQIPGYATSADNSTRDTVSFFYKML